MCFGLHEEGPDLYVYHKAVVIVEVETTKVHIRMVKKRQVSAGRLFHGGQMEGL